MPPLSQQQYTGFTRILKRRYREVWGDVQRELANAVPYADIAGEAHDLEDQATADVLVDINLADIHRNIGEMRDIEAALERIVGQSYGVCLDCGADIGEQRLQAWPTALRCLPCQTSYERLHASTRGPSL
jgi:RNA polymerase-binding protein DksA